MRELQKKHFLTFVLILLASLWESPIAFAAPQDDKRPRIIKEPLQNIEDPLLMAAALENRINLPQFVGVSAVWLGGQVTDKLDSGSQTGIGLSYMERDGAEELWDLQGHWLSSDSAWIQVGKKFLFPYDYVYEPYYRLGVSHFLDPEDALAGFFRINSFKASGSVGFLDLFSMGRLITFEIGLHWGLSGLAYHAQSGLQWNF